MDIKTGLRNILICVAVLLKYLNITTMAKVGAEHGMTLTWALFLSCIFTYILMVAYGQTTLVSGQTALSTIIRNFKFGKVLVIVFSLLTSYLCDSRFFLRPKNYNITLQ